MSSNRLTPEIFAPASSFADFGGLSPSWAGILDDSPAPLPDTDIFQQQITFTSFPTQVPGQSILHAPRRDEENVGDSRQESPPPFVQEESPPLLKRKAAQDASVKLQGYAADTDGDDSDHGARQQFGARRRRHSVYAPSDEESDHGSSQRVKRGKLAIHRDPDAGMSSTCLKEGISVPRAGYHELSQFASELPALVDAAVANKKAYWGLKGGDVWALHLTVSEFKAWIPSLVPRSQGIADLQLSTLRRQFGNYGISVKSDRDPNYFLLSRYHTASPDCFFEPSKIVLLRSAKEAEVFAKQFRVLNADAHRLPQDNGVSSERVAQLEGEIVQLRTELSTAQTQLQQQSAQMINLEQILALHSRLLFG